MGDPKDTPEPLHDPADALIGHDWTAGVVVEDKGSLRAALSNAMVGLMKRYHGKGPERAKTYINDNYVFCVLEGTLTRNEETMVRAGQEHTVREYRLRFQEIVRETTCEAVEQLTHRKVVGYHSQITFDPTLAFEIFVLDEKPAADGAI